MPDQWATPDLQSLVDLFYEDASVVGKFEEVNGAEMPEPYRELLAHSSHMTVTVERFHNSTVDVEVVEAKKTANHYSRKILLKRQTDGHVVQFGIVRLNTSFLSETVRSEIESEQTPLGRILISHNVLRTVKLLSLWKIDTGSDLKKYFHDDLKTCYGRTALIYCDGVPAVELLEIVQE